MAESKEELLSKLMDRMPVLLIVVGVALLALGLAGGVTYGDWFPISDLGARIVAGVLGIAVLLLGVSRAKAQAVLPKAKTYSIKIDHPRDGDEVATVDVRGSIGKPLPEGYTLKIFRIYPGPDSYIPIGDARVQVDSGKWEAEKCHIGGKAGAKRSIGVYLVGPDGSALLDYYHIAHDLHRSTMKDLKEATGNRGSNLPHIKKRTSDMIECHRVSVYRK